MEKTINPLDIPEILFRIGLFIPHHWHKPTRTFAPKHLLSCTLVSRTWRSIMLPILWHILDDSMLPFIPQRILSTYSPHFRILDLIHPPKTHPFHRPNLWASSDLQDTDEDTRPAGISEVIPLACNNLVAVNLVQPHHPWAKDLLRQNRRIKRLQWFGGHFHSDQYGSLDGSVLTGLTALRQLHLECWVLDVKQLMRVLETCPSLTVLSIEFCRGTPLPPPSGSPSPVLTPLPLSPLDSSISLSSHSINNTAITHDSGSSSYHHDPKDDPLPLHRHQLARLFSLEICKDMGSGPLEEIVECCPNLSQLKYMGPDDTDLPALIRHLETAVAEERRPSSIKDLTYSTVLVTQKESVYASLIRAVQRGGRGGRASFLGGGSQGDDNRGKGMTLPTAQARAKGKSADHGLVELQIKVPIVGPCVSEAIIAHGSKTLELLHLGIQQEDAMNGHYLGRILASCGNLRGLLIECWTMERLDDVWSVPWACTKLEKLYLTGFDESGSAPLSSAAGSGQAQAQNMGVDGESSSRNGAEKDACQVALSFGWVPSVEEHEDGGDMEGRTRSMPSVEVLHKLFEQLRPLTHLQVIMLNSSEYVRGRSPSYSHPQHSDVIPGPVVVLPEVDFVIDVPV